MDEETIRGKLRAFKASIEDMYENGGLVCYASKACSFKEMYRIVMQEGCGADVVSGGEMYTALQAGFPAERLYFHGNNKTEAELRMALSAGVGRIVVDNAAELERLAALAVQEGKTAQIYLRVTPGVEAHTHAFIRTGQIDSKFGFTLENGDALRAVKAAAAAEGVALRGLHCHSRFADLDEGAVRPCGGSDARFYGADPGGNRRYADRTESGRRLRHPVYRKRSSEGLRGIYAAGGRRGEGARGQMGAAGAVHGHRQGRSVVAQAGITLYTVGGIKKIPDVRTYVSVDGGMPDNPRYALYKSEYTCVIANKADRPADTTVTVAGRCCESGDLLQENTPLQACEPGDILAVLATGAYNYAMSSNYNRLPRPAVVMVKGDTSRVVVKAETSEDLMRNDL